LRRSTQRRAAVIAAYQHDLTGRPLAETLGRSPSAFTAALAGQAVERAPLARLDRHAHRTA
jgi:transcription antitermination protein NusB